MYACKPSTSKTLALSQLRRGISPPLPHAGQHWPGALSSLTPAFSQYCPCHLFGYPCTIPTMSEEVCAIAQHKEVTRERKITHPILQRLACGLDQNHACYKKVLLLHELAAACRDRLSSHMPCKLEQEQWGLVVWCQSTPLAGWPGEKSVSTKINHMHRMMRLSTGTTKCFFSTLGARLAKSKHCCRGEIKTNSPQMRLGTMDGSIHPVRQRLGIQLIIMPEKWHSACFHWAVRSTQPCKSSCPTSTKRTMECCSKPACTTCS